MLLWRPFFLWGGALRGWLSGGGEYRGKKPRRYSDRRYSLIQRFWIGGVRGVVKPAAGFFSVMTGQHKTFGQRGRGEPFLAKFFENAIGDVVRRLQAHEVEERKWPHRVAPSPRHARIEVPDHGP